MALVAIIHLPENETTFNNIARKLGTTKQSVKQMITILENKGFVLTVPSQYDKRAVNVRITESGAKAMTVCAEKSMGFFANLSSDFSVEEMEILWTLLKKLYNSMAKNKMVLRKMLNLTWVRIHLKYKKEH